MGRLTSAFRCFFHVLKNPKAAEALNKQKQEALKDAKLLLSLLQEEGRLIDFLQEDISDYEDEQIGAAVREIHKKTAQALNKVFTIETVTEQLEGEKIKIVENFDKNSIKLVGNVNKPPFHGVVQHHGWKIVETKKLPQKENSSIIAQAEVEIQ